MLLPEPSASPVRAPQRTAECRLCVPRRAQGDAKSFFLSTAKNTLGVVYAKSQTSGQPMTPVSWTQMRCPETGAVEDRKCAAVGRQVQAA